MLLIGAYNGKLWKGKKPEKDGKSNHVKLYIFET
jgi:hypothetical protein